MKEEIVLTNKKINSKNTSLIINRIICYTVLILLSIMCIFPFYLLFVNSTRYHGDISSSFSFLPNDYFFKNLNSLLNDDALPVIGALGNSFFISASCAILTTYFSALTAFGIHMYNFRFKKVAFIFIMLVMMVPAQVSTLGFIDVVKMLNMMDTFYPLIIPSIAAPVVFFFMKQYMESVLPAEVVEAARVDGSNEFITFNLIVIPMIKPAIAVQAIFTFVSTWNNFFVPALIIDTTSRKTIPLLIAALRSADYAKFDLGKVYVLIFMSIIPVLIVYLILSRYIIKGVTLGSVKG